MKLQRHALTFLGGLLLVSSAHAAGTLHYPVSADPEHLDAWRSTTVATRRVLVNIYEGLTGFDAETGEVVPLLAESWDVSDDCLTYTFSLKQGVHFQEAEGVTYDDREMTASDVEWSFLRYLTEDTDISGPPQYIAAVSGSGAFLAGETDTL